MGIFCKYPISNEEILDYEIKTHKKSKKIKKNIVFKAREYKCYTDNSSKIIKFNINHESNEMHSITDKHSSNLKISETTESNFNEKDEKTKKILMILKRMTNYKSSFISSKSENTSNSNSQITINREISKKCFEELRKYIKNEENPENYISKIPYSSKLYLYICDLIVNPYNERSSQGITEYLSLQYNNQYSFKEFFFVGDENPKKSLENWVNSSKLLIKKYFFQRKIEFACCFTMKTSENHENSRFSYEYSIFVGYLNQNHDENEVFSDDNDKNYSSISI